MDTKILNLEIRQPKSSVMVLHYQPITARLEAGVGIAFGGVALLIALHMLFTGIRDQVAGANNPCVVSFFTLSPLVVVFIYLRSWIVEGRSKTFVLDKEKGYMICRKQGLFNTKLGRRTVRVPLAEISAVEVRMMLKDDFLTKESSLYHNLYLIHTSNKRMLISYLAGKESYAQASQIHEFLNLKTSILTPHEVDETGWRSMIIGGLVDHIQQDNPPMRQSSFNGSSKESGDSQ